MLATGSNMGLVFRGEDVPFQVGKINGRMASFRSAHPSGRGDKMGNEGRPYRRAAGNLAEILKELPNHTS